MLTVTLQAKDFEHFNKHTNEMYMTLQAGPSAPRRRRTRVPCTKSCTTTPCISPSNVDWLLGFQNDSATHLLNAHAMLPSMKLELSKIGYDVVPPRGQPAGSQTCSSMRAT